MFISTNPWSLLWSLDTNDGHGTLQVLLSKEVELLGEEQTDHNTALAIRTRGSTRPALHPLVFLLLLLFSYSLFLLLSVSSALTIARAVIPAITTSRVLTIKRFDQF